MAEQGTGTPAGTQTQPTETPGATGAEQKPNEQTITITQAELDRRLQQASETRERNLTTKFETERKTERERLEQEKLASEKRYEELYQRQLKQNAEAQAREGLSKALAKAGLTELADEINLDEITDLTKVGGVVGKIIAAANKSFEARIEAEVTKRLSAPKPPKAAGTQGAAPTDPQAMPPDQYAEYRKTIPGTLKVGK